MQHYKVFFKKLKYTPISCPERNVARVKAPV